MSTAIERRLFEGQPEPVDKDWLEFLDDVFRNVTLTGFIEHGMDIKDARRLVDAVALNKRLQQIS